MEWGCVPQIRVIIGQSGEGPLATLIAAGVLAAEGMEPATPLPVVLDAVAGAVASGRPDAAILIGDLSGLAAASLALRIAHPEVLVVRIVADTGQDVASVDASDLLRAIQLRFLLGEDAPGALPDFTVEAGQAGEPALIRPLRDAADGEERALIACWIDAQLFAVLARREKDDPAAPDDAPPDSRRIEQAAASAASASADLARHLVAQPPRGSFRRFCDAFRLDERTAQAFLLCLAPDLDLRYQRIFAYLDPAERRPSLTLLATIVEGAPAMLAVLRPLLVQGIVRGRGDGLRDGLPGGDEPLSVDPAITDWLIGDGEGPLGDPRLRPVVRRQRWPGAGWLPDREDRERITGLRRIFESDGVGEAWVVLHSSNGAEFRALVEAAADAADVPLVRLSLDGFVEEDEAGIHARLMRVDWAVRLADAVLAIDGHGVEANRAERLLAIIVRSMTGLERPRLFFTGDIGLAADALPAGAYMLMRREGRANASPEAVLAAAREAGLALAADRAARLAASCPLPLDRLPVAIGMALARGAGTESDAEKGEHLLADAMRVAAARRLPSLATSLPPTGSLDDVVLPQDRADQLRAIVSHVEYRGKVLDDWGFGAQLPYGRGIIALLSGPSGTGKTMAARAIGYSLRRNVFAVDLSRVVSKYIGETEKNLDTAISEAERAGAVLLFDEADALFAKRSEVKDAHDRYANVETAYLLQRIEAFDGLAILTSNLAQNLDRAYLRRLRFIINFPPPDAAAREKIWRQCFPSEAPLEPEVSFAYLARRVELTGGNIRQISLQAAFAAAAEGPEVAIGMRHILRATSAELVKLGRPAMAQELEAAA